MSINIKQDKHNERIIDFLSFKSFILEIKSKEKEKLIAIAEQLSLLRVKSLSVPKLKELILVVSKKYPFTIKLENGEILKVYETLECYSGAGNVDEKVEDKIEPPEDKIEHPEEKIEHPEERIGHPEEKIEHPEERIGHPEKKIENPEERIEHPEEKIEHPEEKNEVKLVTKESLSSVISVLPDTNKRLQLLRKQEVIEVNLTSQPKISNFPLSSHFKLSGHWELVSRDLGGESNHTIRFIDDTRISGKQFVYFIVVNDRLVKIGGSKNTIHDRIQSYNCGVYSLWRGGNGKQSVTNSIIYDSIEICLLRGFEVKLFVWMVPPVLNTLDYWGYKTDTVISTHYNYYETQALRMFFEQFGKNPIWSKNGRHKR
jgi:hypothetical protein